MDTTDDTIDPLAPTTKPLTITWEINEWIGGASPAREAVEIWRKVFGRGAHQPTNEEACVFTVTDSDGHSVEIDLSDEDYAHLFAD